MDKVREKVCHLSVLHDLNDMRILYKECASLAAFGYDVTLIGFGKKADSYEKEGVKVQVIDLPAKNRVEVLTKRTKVIYKQALAVDADLYHVQEPELLQVALKLKRLGKTVIFDSHEFYGLQLYHGVHKPKIFKVPPFLMRLFAKMYMKYEAYVCRRLDAVVEVCTLEGKDYFSGRAAKTCFVRNTPLKQDSGASDTDSVVAKARTVAYVGSLSYERGVYHLIKACHKADARLILAGKFIPAGFESELAALPEFECVDFRGFMDKEGMKKVMQQSALGVSNLLNVGQYGILDTFPTKVLDYMMTGLPVVLSNTPFHVKMNEKYHFGICVEPSDVDALAGAISYLLDNPAEAAIMGQNGERLVNQDWNWDVDAQNLISLYQGLLQSKSR